VGPRRQLEYACRVADLWGPGVVAGRHTVPRRLCHTWRPPVGLVPLPIWAVATLSLSWPGSSGLGPSARSEIKVDPRAPAANPWTQYLQSFAAIVVNARRDLVPAATVATRLHRRSGVHVWLGSTQEGIWFMGRDRGGTVTGGARRYSEFLVGAFFPRRNQVLPWIVPLARWLVVRSRA
jgi:hypothetical protein